MSSDFSDAVNEFRAELWKVIEPKAKWMCDKLNKLLEKKDENN